MKNDDKIRARAICADGTESEIEIPDAIAKEASKILSQRAEFRAAEIDSIASRYSHDMGPVVSALANLLACNLRIQSLIHKSNVPGILESAIFDEMKTRESQIISAAIDAAMPDGRKLRDCSLKSLKEDPAESEHGMIFRHVMRIMKTDNDAQERATKSMESFTEKLFTAMVNSNDDSDSGKATRSVH
jgi:hypothetical protein